MRAPPRGLSILDVMIMVAATAIGLNGSIYAWQSISSLHNTPLYIFVKSDFIHTWYVIFAYYAISIPCLIMWTLALSLLSLRRPRDPIRRLTRQPGIAGCWAASVALMINLSAVFVREAIHSDLDIGIDDIYKLISFNPVGHAILSLWIISILDNRWRPDPNWLDRGGRILSMIWIVETITMQICFIS